MANGKTMQAVKTGIKDPCARWWRPESQAQDGRQTSGQDGKMATPVPLAGCVGFSRTPILTKIGKAEVSKLRRGQGIERLGVSGASGDTRKREPRGN
jgi:hypothetical protein